MRFLFQYQRIREELISRFSQKINRHIFCLLQCMVEKLPYAYYFSLISFSFAINNFNLHASILEKFELKNKI